jgi:hypothetical protein
MAAVMVGGMIGSAKGRAGAGVALGAFLGWIGVIIIACLKPSQEVQVARAAQQLAIQRQAQELVASAPQQYCFRCGRPAAVHGPEGQCP